MALKYKIHEAFFNVLMLENYNSIMEINPMIYKFI